MRLVEMVLYGDVYSRGDQFHHIPLSWFVLWRPCKCW